MCTFSNSASDNSSAICYLATSPTLMPSVYAVVVDDNLNFGNKLLIKKGEISNTPNNEINWGDYTGIVRKFDANTLTAWCAGSFTKLDINSNDIWSTWISEISDSPLGIFETTKYNSQNSIFPNPNKGNFNINIKDKIDAKTIRIEILNSLGQLVHSELKYFSNQEFNIPIKIDNKEGVYYLRIFDELKKNIYNEKFIIN